MKIFVLALAFSLPVASSHGRHAHHEHSHPGFYDPDPSSWLLHIPFSTRAHWMRVANAALPSPCPFAAFGAAIVNHTSSLTDDTDPSDLGELICTGYNRSPQGGGSGNPTLHGEISAINNCTSILGDPDGPYALSPSEVAIAWADLTIYTNAESCPMCASAIRWGGFREYVYGTSIEKLIEYGWAQIDIGSWEVFVKSSGLTSETGFLGEVLTNETDPFFAWQFQKDAPCPTGCARDPDNNCIAA